MQAKGVSDLTFSILHTPEKACLGELLPITQKVDLLSSPGFLRENNIKRALKVMKHLLNKEQSTVAFEPEYASADEMLNTLWVRCLEYPSGMILHFLVSKCRKHNTTKTPLQSSACWCVSAFPSKFLLVASVPCKGSKEGLKSFEAFLKILFLK